MFYKKDIRSFKTPKLPVLYNKLNITEKRLIREEYCKIQNNLCYYCNSDLDSDPPDNILSIDVTYDFYPKNFFEYPIHLHHNHITGLTIGAVHSYCNAILWEHENE